jgi:uncharacterized OsmC-like protein
MGAVGSAAGGYAEGAPMDLRATQRPIKERYRAAPADAQITLRARAEETGAPVSCSVDIGRALYTAEAHAGVGGPGGAACSGDLLLGALAACAQLTCQMVAAAMGLPVRRVGVEVEGDLDLRGTLGIARDAPVGFQAIRLRFALDAPDASEEQLAALRAKTEQYCVVYQTLRAPAALTTTWGEGA